MKYFYLILYIIKDTKGNLHRFFKANDRFVSTSELKNSLRKYLSARGLSLLDIKILAVHELSERDYYEYLDVYSNEAELSINL